jgi:hypothetical protein
VEERKYVFKKRIVVDARKLLHNGTKNKISGWYKINIKL